MSIPPFCQTLRPRRDPALSGSLDAPDVAAELSATGAIRNDAAPGGCGASLPRTVEPVRPWENREKAPTAPFAHTRRNAPAPLGSLAGCPRTASSCSVVFHPSRDLNPFHGPSRTCGPAIQSWSEVSSRPFRVAPQSGHLVAVPLAPLSRDPGRSVVANPQCCGGDREEPPSGSRFW